MACMGIVAKTLSVLFSLAALTTLSFGCYLALAAVGGLLDKLDFQVAVVTTIASIVAFLASLVIARSIRWASQQNRANQLSPQKSETYKLFIDVWEDPYRQGRGSAERSPSKWSEELRALNHLVILYGSPGLVKAHTALRALERERGGQNSHAKALFAVALMEMRKDLGLETQGLTVEELQQLLLVEPDKAGASANVHAYQDLQPRVSLASNA